MSLNQTGFTSQSAITRSQWLFADGLAVAINVKVSGEGITADSNGKKIIKSGMPLAGDLKNTNQPFKFSINPDEIVGILRSDDVDVTKGVANAAILIFGFVDKSMMEQEVQNVISTGIEEHLPKITFIR